MRETRTPYIFSAYANSVGAVLEVPIKAFLTDVPCAALPVNGGMISQVKEDIDFKIGSTQILKIGRASATVLGEYRTVPGENGQDHRVSLATSTVEKINILDVITADAIVSKVTSVYRKGSPVRFSLAGSHFDNLKIDGKAVDCLASNNRFKDDFFAEAGDDLRKGVSEPPQIQSLAHFGRIHLGEVNIYGGKVILTMLRAELGCPFSGSISASNTSTNGRDG